MHFKKSSTKCAKRKYIARDLYLFIPNTYGVAKRNFIWEAKVMVASGILCTGEFVYSGESHDVTDIPFYSII